MSATADGVPFEPVPPGAGQRRSVLRGIVSSPSGLFGATLTATLVVVAVFAPALAPYDPFGIDGPVLHPPSGTHLLGTDALGRDVFSGVIHGTRTSLLIAGTVGALVLLIGSFVGAVSGYAGRWADDVLMRLTEAFQVLPRFFLAIVVIAFFGPGVDRLIIVLGCTSWPMLARLVRAEVLSLKQREFVAAAQAHGASSVRVVVREILPNALPPAIALLGLILAQVILIEASLGFIGLGDPNAMSWGYLANTAQRFLRVAWWLPLFPGLAILLAVLGLNLLGDALTEALGGRR
ncbi:ABC transporter permease [Haloechinothrix halophila]|uniref:ABC transporter permease n=1 Tax=Haloechinothrix halophila TaxID=1069073 RepID=UPI0003FD4CC6|nr:ABC transporter permease [Haloechinothrix halophila]